MSELKTQVPQSHKMVKAVHFSNILELPKINISSVSLELEVYIDRNGLLPIFPIILMLMFVVFTCMFETLFY